MKLVSHYGREVRCKAFMWWVLIRKNDSLDKCECHMLISFVTGPFNLLEVHDSGKGVL